MIHGSSVFRFLMVSSDSRELLARASVPTDVLHKPICGVLTLMLRGLARSSRSSIPISPVPAEPLQNCAVFPVVFPDGSATWEPAPEATESPDLTARDALAEDSASLHSIATPVSTVHCVHSFRQGWAVAAAAIALAVCAAVSGVLATRLAEAIAAPPVADSPCAPARTFPTAATETPSRARHP